MRANQASYPVRMMCRLLGVSPSGFYAWKDRPPSARARKNEALLERIRAIHRFSRGIPRLINTFCDLSLVYGFSEEKTSIGPTEVRAVLEDRRRMGLPGGSAADLSAGAPSSATDLRPPATSSLG